MKYTERKANKTNSAGQKYICQASRNDKIETKNNSTLGLDVARERFSFVTVKLRMFYYVNHSGLCR